MPVQSNSYYIVVSFLAGISHYPLIQEMQLSFTSEIFAISTGQLLFGYDFLRNNISRLSDCLHMTFTWWMGSEIPQKTLKICLIMIWTLEKKRPILIWAWAFCLPVTPSVAVQHRDGIVLGSWDFVCSHHEKWVVTFFFFLFFFFFVRLVVKLCLFDFYIVLSKLSWNHCNFGDNKCHTVKVK